MTPLAVDLTPPMITAAASALRAQQAVGASLSAAATTTRHMLPHPAPAAAELSRNPIEGFSAGLIDDSNVFEWEIMIMGPPDTM